MRKNLGEHTALAISAALGSVDTVGQAQPKTIPQEPLNTESKEKIMHPSSISPRGD
jgi:hypothetical protein